MWAESIRYSVEPALSQAFLTSRSRTGGQVAGMALAVLPLLLGGQAARAATYTVSETSWGTSSTLNSFAWARAQANGNPGLDTISITPGLAINVDGATAVTSDWLTTISDPLSIEGRGATLIGNPKFLSSGGTIDDKFNVDTFLPPPLGSDILLQRAFSFGKLAAGVTLSIDALNTDGLNGYLQLGAGAAASLSNATARNSVSYGSAARSVFDALVDSTLNLSRVALQNINNAHAAEVHQLQRAHTGAPDVVLEAHTRREWSRPDLMRPQQLADPHPPIVQVVAPEQSGPAMTADHLFQGSRLQRGVLIKNRRYSCVR